MQKYPPDQLTHIASYSHPISGLFPANKITLYLHAWIAITNTWPVTGHDHVLSYYIESHGI